MSRSTVVVLSIGRDPQSLAYRGKVLSGAGYVVVEASSAPDIIEKIFETDFDAAVICSSVPAEERNKITRLLRMHRPSVPVLVISAFEGQAIPDGARPAHTDPHRLIPELGSVMEAARPADWTGLHAG